MTGRTRTALGAALVAGTLAAGCSSSPDLADPAPNQTLPMAKWSAAQSVPATDSVYPEFGHSGVDMLHYDLDVAWDGDELKVTEVASFQALSKAPEVRLDFPSDLTVRSVRLGADNVEHSLSDGDLIVHAPVEADEFYELTVEFQGAPALLDEPTQAPEPTGLGLHRTEIGELWSQQQPYGASTWFVANDQPADKAFYDITITTPPDLIGVAGGELVSRKESEGWTTMHWSSAAPTATYLMALSVADFAQTKVAVNDPAMPTVSIWARHDDSEVVAELEKIDNEIAWVQEKLGDFPFSTLNLIVVPSETTTEAHASILISPEPEAFEPTVLIHELAHQWYGNSVTPADWSDLWMSEGMASYLEAQWQDEAWGLEPGDSVRQLRSLESDARKLSGPPAAYKSDHFGADNVYFGPAVMWEEVRNKVGTETFWKAAKAWPAEHTDRSISRQEYLDWLDKEFGSVTDAGDLNDLIEDWLLSPTSPR